MNNKNLLIFIVIALAIVGIVYYFSLLSDNTAPLPTSDVSDDSSISVIEQELGDTKIDNLDAEFADIDAELEATLSEL